MSEAIESQGFKFEVHTTDSPGIWLEVKEMKTWNEAQAESADIDITHLRSIRKEYLVGLADDGTLSMDCNFLLKDPGQLEMRSARSDRQERSFRVTYSDGSIATFSGFVKSFPHQGAVDAAVTGSVSIRVTGEFEIAPAT
jgi:hypothetical protein